MGGGIEVVIIIILLPSPGMVLYWCFRLMGDSNCGVGCSWFPSSGLVLCVLKVLYESVFIGFSGRI